MARAVRSALPPPNVVEGGRGFEAPPMRPDFPAPIPAAPPPYPAESVQALTDLGFAHYEAVAALNMTRGDVNTAASMLFQD